MNAVLKGHSSKIGKVYIEKWGDRNAGLFNLETATGDVLQTYCVNFPVSPITGSKYGEVGWKETVLGSNPNAGKVKWILDHSFPTKSPKDLKSLANIDGELTENDAAAGTQLAIWYFSDNLRGKAESPAAQALSEYLIKNAKILPEPAATLKLGPAHLVGKSGDKLGPIAVNTSASTVDLSLDEAAKSKGVTLVDKAGRPVTTAGNGDELYLTAPKTKDAAEATVTTTASSAKTHGRTFKGTRPDGGPSQTMILAGKQTVKVSAKVSAKWEEDSHTGAIPTVEFREDCAKGGVEVSVGNKGDLPFHFTLDGKSYTVKPGAEQKALVKAGKDKQYTATITGDNGFKKSTSGTLDCGTAPSPAPSESAAPGKETGDDRDGNSGDATNPPAEGDLATTGASVGPKIGIGAAVLALAGGGILFAAKRRRRTS